MAKIVTLDRADFMRGKITKKETAEITRKLTKTDASALRFIMKGATMCLVLAPKQVLAATADATFGNVWQAVMNIVDWVVVGVFIFAGVTWMMGPGQRSRAIEMIIGGASGYILARHAIDVRDFLKTL